MNRHPVSFVDLADLLDGRLPEEARRKVEAHLVAGCSTCQEELSWLQRVIDAARSDDMVEPPAECVAKAKLLHRSRMARPAFGARLKALIGLPSWVRAASMLLVLAVGVTLLLTQVSTLFLGDAHLTALEGLAEVRTESDAEWRELRLGSHLAQGDQLRLVDGAAVLALFDGSILRMQSETVLTLSSLRSGLFGGAHQIVLDQQLGSVDYDVAALRSPFSSFEARSPTVRVTVRGTRFVVTVEKEAETRISVLEGSVHLTSLVQTAVLSEREVAVVPLGAPVVRLPTLLPTATSVSMGTGEGRPSPNESPVATPSEAATRSAATVLPSATAVAPTPGRRPTRAAPPLAVPTSKATPLITPMRRVTATPPMSEEPAATATLAGATEQFIGIIERFPSPLRGVWRIGERNVLVTKDTQIIGRPARGLLATVTYSLVGPSPAATSIHAVLRAVRIEIEAPSSAQTGEPTPTRTLEPFLTPSTTVTAAPTITELGMTTPSPTTTFAGRPSRTPRPTRTPRLPRTPEVSPSPTPTATPAPAITVPTVTVP